MFSNKCSSYPCSVPGADISNAKQADAGKILADVAKQYLHDMDVDDGLKSLGFTPDHIPALVKGTLPQVSHCSAKIILIITLL